MCTPEMSRHNAHPLLLSTHLHYKPQDFADRASGEKGLVQLAVTQDAEAVPRLKGQHKRHCSMRLKPTDRRPANRLALALAHKELTFNYCTPICILLDNIHCLSCYSLPLPLTSPLPSSCSAWLRATERFSQLPHHRVPPSLGLLPHTEDLSSRVYVTGFLLRLESCILSSRQTLSIVLLRYIRTLIYRTLQSAVTMAAQQKRKQSSLPAGEILSHVKTMCRSTSTIDTWSRIQRGPQQGSHAPLRGELAQASRANS